jgi:hypothetical protein
MELTSIGLIVPVGVPNDSLAIVPEVGWHRTARDAHSLDVDHHR